MTGLAAVERERPQLVIADLYQPDGDGLDVIRAARTLAPPAPVIVVTRFSGEPYRLSAEAAGASGFLSKPFESAALLDSSDPTSRSGRPRAGSTDGHP